MIARDMMTLAPTTVCPEHSVWHLARIMLAEHVSGIPVLTDDGTLAGIVTEGDLLRRTELGTEDAFPEDSLHDADSLARLYVKSRSWKVGDVMTRDVVTVDEDASVREIAMLMNRRGIKRLPVMRNGCLIGIVSRADLLKVISTPRPGAQIRGDEALRRAIIARLKDAASVLSAQPAVAVKDGIVSVTGTVRSPAERDVIRSIVEIVAGAGFEDHLSGA